MKRNKQLGNLIDLEPKIYAKLPVEKSKGLLICIDYYVYAKHSNEIETCFWQSLQVALETADIKLIF